MAEKEIIRNAISAAKRDGYNYVVYKDDDGEFAFSRDYPLNNMYKKENIIGKVITNWIGGIFCTKFVRA